MSKGIKRATRAALSKVNQEIENQERQGFLAAGLASEGYAGGYRDALQDVLLMLDGVPPCRRRDYWN